MQSRPKRCSRKSVAEARFRYQELIEMADDVLLDLQQKMNRTGIPWYEHDELRRRRDSLLHRQGTWEEAAMILDWVLVEAGPARVVPVPLRLAVPD